MYRAKILCVAFAFGAAVAMLTSAPTPASAQQAATAPAQPAVQKPVVRARDLVTPQERQAYRQAMRAARQNPAEQQRIRQKMRTMLQERAAARGAVLEMPNKPMPRPEARAEAKPAAPPPRAP